ncbi:Histidinol-phosphatase [hydrothermal vent metagenome]|uniref:histidinol-phosphatase n=1 Tax=hydrothermal vent metagenome TaxID=652676 RepID=A0A1W1BQB2_9ZZZZ
MRVDLHNHTIRCNHADGSVEQYIERAIELGIDIYGFSEHAPMDFDQKYRLSFDEMALYEDEIRYYKNRYEDKIKILLGYEVDYIPNHIDHRVLDSSVDYLIGSIHFIDKWGFDNPEFIGEYKSRDIDTIWIDYFSAVEDMAKSGLFDIVGHFDLIKVFNYLPKKDIRLLATKALKAIKKSNMTLEINSAGLRKPIGEIYPSKYLLEEAYNLNIPITFGSDAHSVDQVGYGYDIAVESAKEVGYKEINIYQCRDKIVIKI